MRSRRTLLIAFCGGKSVGHLAPLVAVWREVKELEQRAEPLFLCTSTPGDASFLAREDVPFHTLQNPPVRLLLPVWILLNTVKAFLILRREQPAALVSKGGSVSIPVVFAARILGVPVVLHESDTVSGRATRLLAHLSQARCRGLPWDREHEPSVWRNAVFTGNPVRRTLLHGSPERARELTGFTDDKPVLLVMGGSQGAKALNDVILNKLEGLLSLVNIIHLTGKGKESDTVRPGYFSLPFAIDELPHFYTITSIALSRSGAGAISELGLFGIPTIFVPLEGLAQNHQVKNAEMLQRLNACVLLKQESLEREIVTTVARLLRNPEECERLSARFRQTASPEAARNVAEMTLALTKNSQVAD